MLGGQAEFPPFLSFFLSFFFFFFFYSKNLFIIYRDKGKKKLQFTKVIENYNLKLSLPLYMKNQ